MTLFENQPEWYNKTFKNLENCRSYVDAIEFASCQFVRCNFKESTLSSCKFHECTFRNCDFSLSNLKDTRLDQVTFDHCHLLGINWADTSLSAKSFLKPPEFLHSELNYSVFTGCHLESTRFLECSLRFVDFSDSILSAADFHGSDMEECRFQNTDLSNTNFITASHYTINVLENKVKHARFSLPEALTLLSCLEIELVNPDDEKE